MSRLEQCEVLAREAAKGGLSPQVADARLIAIVQQRALYPLWLQQLACAVPPLFANSGSCVNKHYHVVLSFTLVCNAIALCSEQALLECEMDARCPREHR